MNDNYLKLKIKQIIAVCKKNMRIYYTQGPILIYGILFPFFLFFAFALGRGIAIKQLIPGLLAISFFFAGSSVGPFITPWETRTKTLERLLTTPGSIRTIILGDILAGIIFSLAISVMIILAGTLLLGGTIANILILLLTIVLASLAFASLGSIFSSFPTDKPANIMMISNLVRLPLIFISGIFVTIENLPGWAKVISFISPLTYFNDIIRFSFGQSSYFSTTTNLLVLIIYTIVFLFLALYFHKRTIIKRI